VRTNVIAAVGHVALQVRDLDAAVEHAVTTMGLRETERTADRVDLTHGAPHPSLQYLRSDVDAVDHVGLEAAGPEAVAEIRARLEARGVPLLTDGPLDDCLTDGLSFEAPGGFVFEVYTGMPKDQPPYLPTGVRPMRFGHVNFGLEDPDPMIDLLLEVLDFRISDRFRGGAFTRCNAEHHGIGVLKGRGILAHHAWEVQVRHVMGNNIAAYMAGPGEILIEYYCDMLHIYDDSTYVAGEWAEDGHKWYSRWSPELPGPAARELGAPPAPNPTARRTTEKERA
jgi:catechol-2,3-dioxygenase